jgi:hypothetical protein
MIDDSLESAADDLAEARVKIVETREALQRAVEAGGGEPTRQELARLDRITADLERVESVVAGRASWRRSRRSSRWWPRWARLR